MNRNALFHIETAAIAVVRGLLLLLLSGAARASEPALNLTTVTVRVLYSTRAEIEEAPEHYQGTRVTASGSRSRPRFAQGFSVLKRNKATGEYVCELYVPRPEKVDDAATMTLGHELRHCLSGDYHRNRGEPTQRSGGGAEEAFGRLPEGAEEVGRKW